MREWPAMSLATGPGEVSNRTLRDHIRPIVNHYDPAFIDLFAHACDLLKQVFINLLANALKFTRTREAAVIEVGSIAIEDFRLKAEGQSTTVDLQSPD